MSVMSRPRSRASSKNPWTLRLRAVSISKVRSSRFVAAHSSSVCPYGTQEA
jgi:hypothetical protein